MAQTNWSIAYREKPYASLFYGDKTPFIPIKNTLRFWAADPFVFEKDGKTYIFAELYDAHLSRGTIGYCKYANGAFTKWKQIIKEDYHLSFPNIFEYQGNVYILPESFKSESIYLYKAVQFPDKWEKLSPLLKGEKFVDTVLLRKRENVYAFSYMVNYPEKNKLYLIKISEDGTVEWDKNNPISSDDTSARPGGKILLLEGKYIRVSQDCGKQYGDALVFSELSDNFENVFSEKVIKRISKNDICLTTNERIYCTHTYNANNNFEVIDMRTDYNKLTYIYRKFFRLLYKIKKKVFTHE